MRLPNRSALFVLVACAFAFGGIWYPPLRWLCLATILAFCVVVAYDRISSRPSSKRWLAAGSQNPIVLRSPFRDQWYVSQIDRSFGYDFERKNGDSWDQPILAPCDGMIAHVENRQSDAPPGERGSNTQRPFGNYVSIETPRGYVILAHLKQGSVLVRVGESVKTGMEIGRCGNSGTSHAVHLHLHAQNQPSRSEVSESVPVAFIRFEGTPPVLLEHGDTI